MRHPLRPPPEAFRSFPSGPASEGGMHVPFFLDGDRVEAEWVAAPLLEGWAGLLHGAGFAALHDEAAIYAMVALAGECGFTTDMAVRFLQPVRLGERVRVVGRVRARDARAVALATEVHGPRGLASTAELTYAIASADLVRRLVGNELSPYLAEWLAARHEDRRRLAWAWGEGGYKPAEPAFDLQPRLRGERLELRPLRREDRDALYEAARDPLVWEQHPERDRWKPEGFARYFEGALASGGAFAIVERASGRIIGSSRYCNLRPGEVEIGWTFLERAHWGGATNGELKRLMLDHAFRFVPRVVFVVGEGNLRSRRAVEKLGATLERSFEQPGPQGQLQRRVLYALSRDAWKP